MDEIDTSKKAVAAFVRTYDLTGNGGSRVPALVQALSAERDELAATLAEARDAVQLWKSVAETAGNHELAANAEIARLREANEWRPIESAPKDGTNVLGGYVGPDGNSVGEMFWWEGWWRTWDGTLHARTIYYPTHWRPLPPPPQETEK